MGGGRGGRMSRSRKRTYMTGPVVFAGIAASALALGQATPAIAAGSGAASAKPRVSFSFKDNRIRTTQRPSIRYTSANLPAGTSLALQRQFGTAHVWKNVILLKGRSGTASVPKVQMGRYRYRIRAYRKGRTVLLSATKLLYSYGRVPLTNICNDANNNSNVTVRDTNGCQTQTVQVGASVFVYLMQDFPPAPPSYDQDIVFGTNTSCRTISLQFAMDNNAGTSDTANIQLVQTPPTRSRRRPGSSRSATVTSSW